MISFPVSAKLILVAVVVGSVLVNAVACTSRDQPNLSSDGPVVFLADENFVQTAYVHADGGETVVFGATAVANKGTRAATLIAARLLQEDGDIPDARAVEVRVVDITDGGDLVGAAVWPFEEYEQRSIALKDFEIAAGAEAEILFVMEIGSSGYWYWPKTELEYSVGSEGFVARTNTGFLICPRNNKDCRKPTGN